MKQRDRQWFIIGSGMFIVGFGTLSAGNAIGMYMMLVSACIGIWLACKEA